MAEKKSLLPGEASIVLDTPVVSPLVKRYETRQSDSKIRVLIEFEFDSTEFNVNQFPDKPAGNNPNGYAGFKVGASDARLTKSELVFAFEKFESSDADNVIVLNARIAGLGVKVTHGS